MKMLYVGVTGLVLLAGCVSGPGLMSSGDSAYSVRVIRPGMPATDVEALIGAGEVQAADRGEVRYASGLHIKYENGTVQSCWSGGVANPATGTDATLATAMTPGATPADVAKHLGAPAYGYEKKSGVVVLYYPRTGVEVTFSDGRLTLWRQTRNG